MRKKPISLDSRRNKYQDSRVCYETVNAAGNVEMRETITQPNGEVYCLVTEYADPTPEQDLALEIFWRALLADLQAHVLERVAA